MTRRVYWFVFALSLVAVLAAWYCYAGSPQVAAKSIPASLWFGSLILLGYVSVYGRRPGATQTVAYLPILACVLAAPTWVTVSLVGCVTALAEAPAKRELVKKIFNIAKVLLGASVAVLVYRAVHGRSLVEAASPPGFLDISPSLLGAAAAFLVLDATALAAVVSISADKRFSQLWIAGVRGIPRDLLAAPLAYVFGRVYLAFGGAGVAWLGLPLIGLRQLYSANWELKRTNEELLELMVAAIEARDPYTSGHSRRVAEYSRIVAEGLGLPPKKVEQVAKAALLHDVGKIDEKYAPLLRKPGRLTPEEEAVMQTHAARSAELVAKVSSLGDLIAPVRHHHEAWDGTGYPDGLAGERIPLAARIIAFADTVDAMTSERPYRAGLHEELVRAEIVRCRGTQFDPAITDQVLSAEIWARLFPPGTSEVDTTAPGVLTLARAVRLTG